MNVNNIIQGGSTANRHGKIFEEILIPIFTRNGYRIFTNKEILNEINKQQYEQCNKSVLLQAPYTTIYNTKGRTEFLIKNNLLNRNVRVECKWQQASGSVDEKFPYMLLNCIYAFEEEEIILVVDGNGYKPKAREWLENKIDERWLLEENLNKRIRIMYLSEFITYFNNQLS